MAATLVKGLTVKQTYYFGKKTTQTGKQKGRITASFIHVDAKAANKMGLKLALPTNIPGTVYKLIGGIIHQTSKTSKGIERTTPVSAQNCSKPVRVHLNKTVTKDINGRGAKIKVKLPESVIIGVPTWATIDIVRAFLKTAKSAVAFTMDNGQKHPVKVSSGDAK
jgi:hypothetical protein